MNAAIDRAAVLRVQRRELIVQQAFEPAGARGEEALGHIEARATGFLRTPMASLRISTTSPAFRSGSVAPSVPSQSTSPG